MNELKGKLAVITGAASGIGRALALQLGHEGCVLAVVDIDEKGLTETCRLLAEYPQQVACYVVDIGDKEQIFSLAEKVSREKGGADLLINNAGFGTLTSFLDMRMDIMERIMQVNFWEQCMGAKHSCRSFCPNLKLILLTFQVLRVWSLFRTIAPMFPASCPTRIHRSSKTGSAPDPHWGFLRFPWRSQNEYCSELLGIYPKILGNASRSRRGI